MFAYDPIFPSLKACNIYAGRSNDKIWADQLHQAIVIVKGNLDKLEAEQNSKGGDKKTQRSGAAATSAPDDATNADSSERDIASEETTVSYATLEQIVIK